MNGQRTLSSWHSNTRTGQVGIATNGRARAPKFESASARVVRPLAASAQPQRFGAGSGLCAEPAFGIEEKPCIPGHSFLAEKKNPVFRSARLALCEAIQSKIQAGCAAQAAMPNPSIERDVQELSLLAAPHVKR
jgi:hypothetical protein